MLEPPKTSPLDVSEPELRNLIKRAEAGDRTVLKELRAYLDNHPTFWQEFGDLATWCIESWLNLISGQNLLLKESIRLRLEAFRQEFGAQASLLDTLLVERITATWLAVNYADTRYAQLRQAGAPVEQLRVIAKLQDSAHARHLAALKVFAQVRKLVAKSPSPLDLVKPVAETDGTASGSRTRKHSAALNN